MIYAITDVGSNTIKMDIFELENPYNPKLPLAFQVKNLYGESVTAGLGTKRKGNILTSDGVNLMCDILERFRNDSQKFHCDSFRCYATASLRGIDNTFSVLSNISNRIHVNLRIVAGIEEAEINFSAFLKCRNPGEETGIMIDMGGGSTEFVAYNLNSAKKTVVTDSLPFGCAVLASNPEYKPFFPTLSEQEKIYEKTIADINALNTAYSERQYADKLFILGGTAKAIYKLIRHYKNLKDQPTSVKRKVTSEKVTSADGKYTYVVNSVSANPDPFSDVGFFTADDFCEAYDFYISSYKNAEAAEIISVMLPDRVSTVLAGAVAFKAIIDKFAPKKIVVAATGVREGYLVETLNPDRKIIL